MQWEMGHTWKNKSNFQNWFNLGKLRYNLKNGSRVEKQSHVEKRETQMQKLDTRGSNMEKYL